jgi:anti-anti-sigma regulatory factor
MTAWDTAAKPRKAIWPIVEAAPNVVHGNLPMAGDLIWDEGTHHLPGPSLHYESEGNGRPRTILLDHAPSAKDIREQLLHLRPDEPPVFDAEAVERLSTTMVQILLSCMKHAIMAGQEVVVLNPSFAFNLAFRAFGFADSTELFSVQYR